MNCLETLGWESLSNNCKLPRPYLYTRAKGYLDPGSILSIIFCFSLKYQDCIAAREPVYCNNITAPNCFVCCLYNLSRGPLGKVLTLVLSLNSYLLGPIL